jgi:hypothetical protein
MRGRGAKGSIYGGLAGSAFMGIVSGPRMFFTIRAHFPLHLFERVHFVDYSRYQMWCCCIMIPAILIILSRLWKLFFDQIADTSMLLG